MSNPYYLIAVKKAQEASAVAALIGSGNPHVVGQMVMNFMAMMNEQELYSEFLVDSLFWDHRNPAGLPVLDTANRFQMFDLGFKDSEYYHFGRVAMSSDLAIPTAAYRNSKVIC